MFAIAFDSTCPACSQVGKAVTSLGVPGLTVMALNDHRLTTWSGSSGRTTDAAPALVEIHDGAVVQVWQGWSMRVRLARVLGPRRARAVLVLLASEARARVARRAEAKGRPMGRRTLLGGAAAIGAGTALATAAPTAFAAERPAGGLVPATPGIRGQALATTVAEEAVTKWGAVGTAHVFTTRDAAGDDFILLFHQGTGAMTVYQQTASGPEGAVTVTVDVQKQALLYHLPTGEELAELTVADGRVVVKPASASDFAYCFAACLGGNVDEGCVVNCATCALGGLSSLVDCGLCAYCAGPKAVGCARKCI